MGFDLSQVDFDTLREVDVRTADPDSLVDIKEITIDQKLPREQRIAEFVRQVRNPYCFKVGKIAVSVGFSPGRGDIRAADGTVPADVMIEAMREVGKSIFADIPEICMDAQKVLW